MLTCQHLKSIPTFALMFLCIPDGSFRHGRPRHRLACGLGHKTALALLTPFTTVLPLRYLPEGA